jgi:hypothetical protein
MATTFAEFVHRLKAGPVVPQPPEEPWKAMIERTGTPGQVCEVDEETFDHFLGVLPPRWMGSRSVFAFGEGSDHLRLFWQSGQRRFCRQLSEEENATFCRLVGISLSSG